MRFVLSLCCEGDKLRGRCKGISGHALRRKVRVWTVNESSDIRRLYDLGVDAIFTDDPLASKEFYASEKLLDEDPGEDKP